MELDPRGYFVIRVRDNKVEVGFCEYQEIHRQGGFGDNIFCDILHTDNLKELLTWVDKNAYITRPEHRQYIIKEFHKAMVCIKNNTQYIQD